MKMLCLICLLLAFNAQAQEGQTTEIRVEGDAVAYCRISPTGIDFWFEGALIGQTYPQRNSIANIGNQACIATEVKVFRIKPDGTETEIEHEPPLRDVVEADIPQRLDAGETSELIVHWSPRSAMDGEDTFRIDVTWDPETIVTGDAFLKTKPTIRVLAVEVGLALSLFAGIALVRRGK